MRLSTLSTDASSQLDVLGHNSDALGVNGAEVGIFKQTNEVSFAGFLKCHHSRALEAQVSLEILGDFTHKSLERQLADEQLRALLIPSDLAKSDCSRPEAMWLLDSSGSRGALASGLGRQLFAGSLASSGLASCLLGTSHFSCFYDANCMRAYSELMHDNRKRLYFMPAMKHRSGLDGGAVVGVTAAREYGASRRLAAI